MNIIKKSIYTLLSVALCVGLFSSCVKEDPYKPAPKETNAGVFFKSTSSAVTLTTSGSFDISVSRNNATSEYAATLQVTAPDIFIVPTVANFTGTEVNTKITVTYDPAKVEYDKKYVITVKATPEDATLYGADSCVFTAVLPNPIVWEAISTEAVIKENIFGAAFTIGENTFAVYVEKMKDKEIYRIANLFSTYKNGGKTYTHPLYGKSIEPGEIVNPDEVCWTIIDMDGEYLKKVDPSYTLAKDKVFIPRQTTNVEWQYGEMNFASTPYNLSSNGSVITPSDKYPLGVWNKDKKTITFGSIAFNLPTEGWAISKKETILYLDKSYMIEDYNTYNYKTLLLGDQSSMMFTEDGEDPREWSGQKLSICKDDETIFYLNDYFGDGYGLAFTAEGLNDGTLVKNVANDQETGQVVLGHKVYCSISKGKVSVGPNEDDLPVIELTVSVFAKNEDGEVTLKFGSFTEEFTATEVPEVYTSDDIVGATKADYVGSYTLHVFDCFNEIEGELDITLSDAGKDEDGTEWMALDGLSAFGPVEVEWYKGYLYISPQPLPNKYTYKGTEYEVSLYPFDNEAKKFSRDTYVLGGFVESNGKLALVGYPDTPTFDGVYFAIEPGGLISYNNMFGVKESDEAPAIAYKPFAQPSANALYTNKPLNYVEKAKAMSTHRTFHFTEGSVPEISKTVSEDAIVF